MIAKSVTLSHAQWLARLGLAIALVFLGFVSAYAKPLVGDLSEYHVNIDSTFTGKNLILFGAQNDPGEIMVVVRGPERNVTIRKKKKVFGGIWVNGENVTFENIPYYYALNGNGGDALKAEEGTIPPLYQAMQMGKTQLQLTPNKVLSPLKQQEFAEAFFTLQEEKGLLREFSEPLKFMGDTLFKTLITFPDTLPRGDYAVDMYLLEDDRLRGVQTLPITVEKVGFDAFIYDMAHNRSVLYAIMAIAIALTVGWSISQLFSRIV
jgi:uncharacterized protein (TIGR02186 family)